MVLTVSIVVLLGVVIGLLFRKGAMNIWHFLICTIFGFYLASTSIAPTIRAGGTSLAHLIDKLNF